jgi:signal transduction histidine kinase
VSAGGSTHAGMPTSALSWMSRPPKLTTVGDVSEELGQARADANDLRRLIPPFTLLVAIVAAATDPAGSAVDLILAAIAVAAFAVWAYVPGVPLWALSLAVLCPVVAAQRSGQLEPLLFDVSVLGFVIGRWAPSRATAVALGVLAAASPVAASLQQDPAEIAVGIWILGIAFPWALGRAAARQNRLARQLDASRRELAQQALLSERRRIARDVHDLVGHGLAAVMLQITGARHVLRRDPDAAEEALRAAEELGRRSMQELRGTVALLRSDDASAAATPLPSAREIAELVERARGGGLAVELRTRGDPSPIAPSVGVALYRIAQEALSNAAQHAPLARTVLELEVTGAWASLIAATNGPTRTGSIDEPEGPGYGLIGMRERATALGGEFDAGPTAEGWRVSCRIPFEAEEARSAGKVGAP